MLCCLWPAPACGQRRRAVLDERGRPLRMGMCCETRRPRRQRRWTSLTCIDASFQVLTRAGHPWRGPCSMGLVDAGRTPPTVGCRTRETERRVKKDAARPRVIRREPTAGGAAMRGAAVLRLHRRTAHERGRSSARVNSAKGRAARREAASPLETADRRMSKLRYGPQTAKPQA